MVGYFLVLQYYLSDILLADFLVVSFHWRLTADSVIWILGWGTWGQISFHLPGTVVVIFWIWFCYIDLMQSKAWLVMFATW